MMVIMKKFMEVEFKVHAWIGELLSICYGIVILAWWASS